MQVWTCRQHTKGYCSSPEFTTNSRHITPEGEVTFTPRKNCPLHWLNCPHCWYFDTNGTLISPGAKE